MNKYLKISNNGLIEKEDMTLIGSSTKRGDTTKIGQYGSGNKFWMAYALRNDMLPIIYRGKDILPIDFKIVLHRDAPVRVLVIDGQETSITAGMGELDWKCWMALREVVCNAIDEGGMEMETIFGDNLSGEDNKTSIYIPITGELSDVMMEYDKYFAFKRKASYENLNGRVFERDTLEDISIYRKGVRCLDSRMKTSLDFDFNEIKINESRVSDNYEFQKQMKAFMRICDNGRIFYKIIKEFSGDYLHETLSDAQIDIFKGMLNSGTKVKPKFMQDIAGLLGSVGCLIIPNKWFEQLKDLGLVVSDFDKLAGGGEFMELGNMNTKEIEYYLKSVNCNYPVKSGILSQGKAMIDNKTVYVDEKAFKGFNSGTFQCSKIVVAEILYAFSIDNFLDIIK